MFRPLALFAAAPFRNPHGVVQMLMRTGNDNGRILQVMPWPVYQDMTERDLRAIYEYLRALPQ